MANKMRRDALRRWVVSGIAAALLAALYGIIFRFSAQDGEQSGSLSQEISARCVDILNSLSGGDWSEASMSGCFRASHQEAGPFLGVCVHGDSGVYTAEPMDEAREGEMPADGSVGLPLGGL